MEVVQTTPQEQDSERIVELFVDVPVHQIFHENVKVVELVPQERVQQRTAKIVVNVAVTRIMKEILRVNC